MYLIAALASASLLFFFMLLELSRTINMLGLSQLCACAVEMDAHHPTKHRARTIKGLRRRTFFIVQKTFRVAANVETLCRK